MKSAWAVKWPTWLSLFIARFSHVLDYLVLCNCPVFLCHCRFEARRASNSGSWSVLNVFNCSEVWAFIILQTLIQFISVSARPFWALNKKLQMFVYMVNWVDIHCYWLQKRDLSNSGPTYEKWLSTYSQHVLWFMLALWPAFMGYTDSFCNWSSWLYYFFTRL